MTPAYPLFWPGSVPSVNGPELLPVSGQHLPELLLALKARDGAEQKLQSKEPRLRQFTNRGWQVSSVFLFRCFVLGLNLLLPCFCSICILLCRGVDPTFRKVMSSNNNSESPGKWFPLLQLSSAMLISITGTQQSSMGFKTICTTHAPLLRHILAFFTLNSSLFSACSLQEAVSC